MMCKFHITRSISYMAIINSGMILFLFLSDLEGRGTISFNVSKYFIPILIAGIILFSIIGWIEINLLKGIQSETNYSFSISPPFVEMKREIDELYSKLIGDKKEIENMVVENKLDNI